MFKPFNCLSKSIAGFLITGYRQTGLLRRSNSFFRPKTVSKVAIIKTKSAAIAFFSSPPFLPLALSLFPFFSFVSAFLFLCCHCVSVSAVLIRSLNINSVFYLFLVAICKAFLQFRVFFNQIIVLLMYLSFPATTSFPAICGANYSTFVFLSKE